MNLTQEEYEQLKAIRRTGAKFIARDKNNVIYSYSNKPHRLTTMWDGDVLLRLPDNDFPSITWESEPLNIDEALEGRGCKFCEKADFSNFMLEIDKYRAGVSLALGSTKFPKKNQFKYCPNCGRRLEESK